MRRFTHLVGGLILTWLIAGCGYVSTSSYLEHIKTIRIPPVTIEDPLFQDTVSEQLYDELIQEQLIARFNRKWRDGNDSQLDLTILDYDLIPFEFDASNNPTRFRMQLQIEYKFTDHVQNKIVEHKDNYLQIHEFYIAQVGGEEPETFQQAKQLLIEELIEDLYSLLAEQW